MILMRDPIANSVNTSIRKNSGMTILMLASIIGSVILAVIPPLVLGRLVDSLAEGSGISLQNALYYFLLLVLSGFLESVRGGLITIFGQKVTHQLRSDLAAKLQRLPASAFAEKGSGETGSLFVNDVNTVETLFDEGIISMFTDLAEIVSILFVIFTRSSGLGILLLIALPFLFLLTRHFQKSMLKAQKNYREAVARTAQQIPESLKNHRLIRVLNLERYMAFRYNHAIQDGFDAMEKSNFYDSIYSPIILTVSALITAIMMILSASGGRWQAFFGMSVGTAVAVIAYVGKIFDPLESIGMEIQNIQSAAAGLVRIRTFLNLPEEASLEDGMIDESKPPVFAEHVTFGYDPETIILNDFSLELKQGEMATLIGRTGAGKSTFFKLLLGLYEPQKGKISIYGAEPATIREQDRRLLFGYAEQQFHPIPGTIRDQITLNDPRINEEKVQKAIDLCNLRMVVQSLPEGLDTPYESASLSQGQIQLLSIARAAAADPKILLLDEITANLDSNTEAALMTAMKNASKDRTVLSISHRLYEEAGGRKIPIQAQAD